MCPGYFALPACFPFADLLVIEPATLTRGEGRERGKKLYVRSLGASRGFFNWCVAGRRPAQESTPRKKRGPQTPSSSCIHSGSGFGSAVNSMTSFSKMSRLLGGLERSERSAFATRRIARVSSRLDL